MNSSDHIEFATVTLISFLRGVRRISSTLWRRRIICDWYAYLYFFAFILNIVSNLIGRFQLTFLFVMHVPGQKPNLTQQRRDDEMCYGTRRSEIISVTEMSRHKKLE